MDCRKDRTRNIELANKFLIGLECDTLYHIGLDNRNHDLVKMFNDVKFVIMGGSAKRMEKFAHYIKNLLKIDLPSGCDLIDIAEKTNRYAIYKIGPVLSVSHGIGSPSLSIILHEVYKLLHYAKCRDVTFIRIGTCGLIGKSKGSIVITNKVYDSLLREHLERVCCGKVYKTATDLDQSLVSEIKEIANKTMKGVNVVCGGTMASNDFYEEQGRMDGYTCRFTSQDRLDFLHKLQSKNIMNIEMETCLFAGFCKEARVSCAIICVGLLNRLDGDQVVLTEQDYSTFTQNLFQLTGNFIVSRLQTE